MLTLSKMETVYFALGLDYVKRGNDMTIEELIALMEYKAENIKAKFSPDTFKAVAEALRRLKELEDE